MFDVIPNSLSPSIGRHTSSKARWTWEAVDAHWAKSAVFPDLWLLQDDKRYASESAAWWQKNPNPTNPFRFVGWGHNSPNHGFHVFPTLPEGTKCRTQVNWMYMPRNVTMMVLALKSHQAKQHHRMRREREVQNCTTGYACRSRTISAQTYWSTQQHCVGWLLSSMRWAAQNRRYQFENEFLETILPATAKLSSTSRTRLCSCKVAVIFFTRRAVRGAAAACLRALQTGSFRRLGPYLREVCCCFWVLPAW